MTQEKPLDFVYEKASNSYNMALYDTDEKLLQKIQTGKGDPSLYTGSSFIFIEGLFAGTVPDTVEQRDIVGSTQPIG